MNAMAVRGLTKHFTDALRARFRAPLPVVSALLQREALSSLVYLSMIRWMLLSWNKAAMARPGDVSEPWDVSGIGDVWGPMEKEGFGDDEGPWKSPTDDSSTLQEPPLDRADWGESAARELAVGVTGRISSDPEWGSETSVWGGGGKKSQWFFLKNFKNSDTRMSACYVVL